MSGHSKWSTIKRKKGALDAKRSKIFSRIVKEIMVAVKDGGSTDTSSNSRLRLAIQNAKGANMPKDNIARAISKANKNATHFVTYNFEGYAHGGIAIYVECLSNNSNRTISNMRAVFNRYNGSMGTQGSLDFIFDRKGIFTITKGNWNLEEFELKMIDAGIEDLEIMGDKIILICPLDNFGNVQKKLEDINIEPENAELQRIPNNTTTLSLDDAKKVLKMIDFFEEDEDVQNVYHNLRMTPELEKKLNEEI